SRLVWSPSQAPAPATTGRVFPLVNEVPQYDEFVLAPPDGRDWVALTSLPLPVEAANAWVTTPGSGAVVSFLGVVREQSDGRPGVRGLTYEAYEEEATRRLAEIADELRRRWPDV